MKRWLMTLCVAAAISPLVYAQAVPGQGVAGMNVDKVVEMGQLTQSELADKIKNGWTNVFIVTGGTEIRGPHAVIGVHNTLATHRAIESAKRSSKPFALLWTGACTDQRELQPDLSGHGLDGQRRREPLDQRRGCRQHRPRGRRLATHGY